MINYKRIFRYVLAAVAALGTVALLIFLATNSGRQYEGTLNVLNWTSYIPMDVIYDFENEYHIKVNYLTYSSNEELIAKITSSNEGTYDVIFPSDYAVSLLKSRDLITKIDTSKLENFRNLDTRFLGQPYDARNEYFLPFLLATTVIAYDKEKKANLNSYRDLFDTEFSNDLILLDDQRVIIGAMLNTLGYSINDTDDKHLAESLELFDTLRPNIKAFDSDSPKTFFITDEVGAGIVWSAEAILAKKSRPTLEIVYPEEGFVISMDNYCITKNAKNEANAYLFIDYLLRDEVSRRIVEEYPYISPNMAINSEYDADELDEIFGRGTYIENLGGGIKKYDRLWAQYK